MTPRTTAMGGLAVAGLLLAGACSQDVLIDVEQGGGTSTSTGGGGASSGPIDPDAAARVAILLRSCGLADAPAVILDRFYTIIPGPDDGVGRMAQAISCIDASIGLGGCAGVKQCLGISASASNLCLPGCFGSVLHTCDGNVDRTLDCAKLGLACAPGANRCFAAPLGPACDEGSFASTCQGGVPEACKGTVVHGPDCAAHGLVCEPIDTGEITAVCRGKGPSCGGGMSFYGVHLEPGAACEGNVLRACVNGREHQVDCTQIGVGFSCQTVGPGAFCGLAAECVPGEEKTACDSAAKTLFLCNAGRRDEVSCAAVGLPVGCEDDHCSVGLGGP